MNQDKPYIAMQNQLSHQRKTIDESTWGWEWPQAKKIHKTIQTHSKRSCSLLKHAAPQNPTALNLSSVLNLTYVAKNDWANHWGFFSLHSEIRWTYRISRDGARICKKVQPCPLRRQKSNSGKKCDMVGSLIKGSFSNPGI